MPDRTTLYARKALKVIRPLIEGAGAKCWLEKPTGRGHARLVIEIGGITRFTPMSGTPSQPDQFIKQKTSDVKRILKELGA